MVVPAAAPASLPEGPSRSRKGRKKRAKSKGSTGKRPVKSKGSTGKRPVPSAREGKALVDARLCAMPQNFQRSVDALGRWLFKYGHMPWRLGDCEERRLSKLASDIRLARFKRFLSDDQIATVESIPRWRWEHIEQRVFRVWRKRHPDSQAGPAAAWPEGDPHHDHRRKVPVPPHSAGGGAQEPAGLQSERHVKATLLRLANNFARERNATRRRALLRNWQRLYHPDKHPRGKHAFVTPVFQWVQAMWERCYRKMKHDC